MKNNSFIGVVTVALTCIATLLAPPAFAAESLLNVSYDVARELYKEINPAFVAKWKSQGGGDVTINQSHGGSSKQAGAVIGGLEADVVTMNQPTDIDILVQSGGLVDSDWRQRFPNRAVPYTSIAVFLVRKGNPKKIRDWDDLIKPGMQVIIPNPKVTGNGRYTYLAAWGYALGKSGSDAGARSFVKSLFANVPVLDGGGRGATTTFAQRGIGDVLVTFENEAILLEKELGSGKFEIVYPSLTVNAPAPVALVRKVVNKHGTEKLAKAYLDFLFTPEGQTIIARHYLRPLDAKVLARFSGQFPAVKVFDVEDRIGPWATVQKTHFADGGVYDQIVTK